MGVKVSLISLKKACRQREACIFLWRDYHDIPQLPQKAAQVSTLFPALSDLRDKLRTRIRERIAWISLYTEQFRYHVVMLFLESGETVSAAPPVVRSTKFGKAYLISFDWKRIPASSST